jgi:hypothetical protein
VRFEVLTAIFVDIRLEFWRFLCSVLKSKKGGLSARDIMIEI